MAAKSKWIAGLDPDRPASLAAKLAIAQRMQTVWRWLELAADSGVEEPEAVHQLRVASRRATATLVIFADLLPRQKAKRLKRQLKEVRDAAGAARDLDVELARWRRQARRTKPIAAIVRLAEQDRLDAQPAIVRVRERLKRNGFLGRVDRIVERVRFRKVEGNGHECSLREAARTSLSPLCEALWQVAAGDLSEIENLHRFRIEGKRLRYAMEVFAPAFDPSFREGAYAAVEELQERLGNINDRAAAQERIETWSEAAKPAHKAALLKLAAREAAACNRLRKDFLAWWTPRRQAALRRQLEKHVAAKPHSAGKR